MKTCITQGKYICRNDRVYDMVTGTTSSDTGYRIIDEFVAVFNIPFNSSVHLITLNDFIF